MLKRSAKWVAVLIVLAFALWWFSSYRISEYRGDGQIRDSGVWTYLRYHVELGKIPFYENGVHQFRLVGLPSEEMTLELVVDGKSDKDRPELARLKTNIEAILRDDLGKVVCNAGGVPSDGIRDNAWILKAVAV